MTIKLREELQPAITDLTVTPLFKKGGVMGNKDIKKETKKPKQPKKPKEPKK